MPSKFTAYLHFSQTDMDKLAKIEPSILENDGNISKIIRTLFDNLIDGRYIQQEKEKINIALKNEKTKQEVIKLKIQNKIAMIHDLKLAPEQANLVTEKNKPLEAVIGGLTDSPTKNVNDISPYDESNHRLECIDCGVLFEFKGKELASMLNVQTAYLEHRLNKHDAKLTDTEKSIFKNLGIPV